MPILSPRPTPGLQLADHRSFRILHTVFSSRLAGSERYCAELANQQAALGHEVHVAGMKRSPLREALAPNVRFHGFGPLFRGWQLRRLVARLEPDVCHGHLSAACKALGRISGAHRSVATLHVGYKPHQHGRLDGVICVNRAQSARLEGYTGMARTIPNWMPERPTIVPLHGLRAELGIAKDAFLVGCVGRLHASKGADVLIEAFQRVAPFNAALVILGEGPQRAQLERLRGDDARIYLPGFRADVQSCLRDLDLFVSPSREESFGLAIVEAMGAQVPLIATAAEGPSEYLQDQPVALVPPGDIDTLADALAAAVVQFQKGQLRRVAYDLRYFDPPTRVGHIMDFYGQVLRREGSRDRQWAPATAAS